MKHLLRDFIISFLFIILLSSFSTAKDLTIEKQHLSNLKTSVVKSDDLQTLETQGQELTPIKNLNKSADFNKASSLGGGDDISTATAITALPFSDVGSTVGMTDDYDEACVSYIGNAPDVVYSFAPPTDTIIDISLCESDALTSPYWTHMWVYQNDAHSDSVVACVRWSTACSTPLSALFEVNLLGGETYYIVIDGENGQSGDYQIDVSATPPPPPPTFAGSHPTIGDGGTGYNLISYEDISQLMFTDDVLVWFGTDDDFNSYSDVVAYSFNDLPTYPSIDYWGEDSVFYGTLTPSALDNHGASTYLMQTDNAANSDYISLGSWDWWDGYGWHDMKLADIACEDGEEFTPGGGIYRFGIISMIHTTPYPDPSGSADNIIDGPFVFYQTTSDISGTISWYNDLNNCLGTSIDIDKVTHFSYAVYDPYDDVDNQRVFFIRRDVFGDPDDEIFSGGYTYSLDPGDNISYPAVAAYNGHVLIVSEYYSDSNPDDRDLICWYDPTTNGSLESLEISLVTATMADERFPRLTHIQGTEFICTYHQGDNLYRIVTLDGGVTWGAPRKINLEGDIVINEYRAHDVSELGSKVMYEYLIETDTLLRLLTTSPFYEDIDEDGIVNYIDNCPETPNNDQADIDGDLIGDVCDNCINIVNRDQSDGDEDGDGDACDECTDSDDDGYGDPGYAGNTCSDDNCPTTPNPSQDDFDTDGVGDLCDNCMTDVNPDQADVDDDSVGDVCDNCLNDSNTGQEDVDSDDVGDVCDNCIETPNTDQTDSDSDDVGDACDNCQNEPNFDQADNDIDGVGNVCDNCPDNFNPNQTDTDSDGKGDACDGCCLGDRGNFDGDIEDAIDIADLVFMVEFQFLSSGIGPPCLDEADVAPLGEEDGSIDIADLVFMVEHQFLDGPAPSICP